MNAAGGAFMVAGAAMGSLQSLINAPWGSPSIPESQREAEIKGIRQTVASYGRVIPIVIGTTRLAPNVIMMPQETFAHVAGSSLNLPTGYEFWALGLGMALCEGPILGIGACWRDGVIYSTSDGLDAAEVQALSAAYQNTVTLGGSITKVFLGAIPGPTDWTTGLQNASLLTNYTAYGHPGIAWVWHDGIGRGSAVAAAPNYQYEVRGACITGPQVDANAADALALFATDPRRGIGGPSTIIESNGSTALRNYSGAMGFGISWAITEQTSALVLMRVLLDACNCTAVDSGGQIKVICLGDSDVSANGYTYVANRTPVFDLGDDDFIATQGQQPIRIERKPEQECPNTVPVQFYDARGLFFAEAGARASSAYEKAVVESPVMSDAARTLPGGAKKGIVRSGPVTLPMFTSRNAALVRSRLYGQRAAYVRNRYTVRLGWKAFVLEKGDLLRIGSEAMRLKPRVVRITGRKRDRNAGTQGEIEITAEDAPFGTYTASAYTVQEGDSGAGAPVSVPPSSAHAPTIFMPPHRQPDGTYLARVATSGGATVGRIDVWYGWASGGPYSFAGSAGPCTYGVLAAELPVGAPLDTVNTLSVTLTAGVLPDATATDRDALTTKCWVGNGELVSYATSSLVSGTTYALTSLLRGCEESLTASHLAGAAFVRMDSGPVPITVPDARRGQTLYVKCLTWNQSGTIQQSLADAVEYSFVVPGGYRTGKLPMTISFADFDREDWFIY